MSTWGPTVRRSSSPQLAFALGVACFVLFRVTASEAPPAASLWWAFAGVVALTALTLCMQLGRQDCSPWLSLVPIADVALFWLIRNEIGPLAAAAPSLLLVVPLLWGAFSFSAWAAGGLWVVTVGGFALMAMRAGVRADSALLAAQVVLPSVMATIIIVSAHLMGRQVLRDARRLGVVSSQLQNSLRATSEQATTLQTVLDAVKGPIAIFDPSGRPVVVNVAAHDAAALAGFHLTSEGFERTGTSRVYGADRHTPTSAPLDGAYRLISGETPSGRTIWLGPDGQQRAFAFEGRQVRGPDERLLGGVIVGAEITALAEAVRVRDTFLDSVGHELRTPLSPLMGYADLLQDDPATRRIGEQIERSTRRLGRIVDQLITAGREEIRRSVPLTPTSDHLQRIESAHAHAAAAGGVDLIVVDDAARAVRFDPRDLDHVLDALVENALHFTPPGGSVTVQATPGPAAEQVSIRVADTGAGMTDDERRQAFDRFYRTSSAIVNAMPGLGLGLSIARDIVRANRAVLELHPHQPTGTVATITISSPSAVT